MKTIENQTFGAKEKAITEAGHDLLTIRNVEIDIIDMPESSPGTSSYGCDLRRNKVVEIDNLTITASLLKRKYAYGLRLGYAKTLSDANGIVRIKNSTIKGFGPSSGGNYAVSNRDGIALEGGELWLKDTVISGVSDACIDSKGSVKALNCTFEGGYRDIRIWAGQTVYLSNCKVGSVWLKDNTAKLILFNTERPTTIEVDTGQLTALMVQTATKELLTDPFFLPEQKLFPTLATLVKMQSERVAFEQAQLDYYRSLS